MQLIDHWKHAWKLSSVQLAMLIAVIGAVQAGLPDMGLPESTYAMLNTALAVVLAVARIVAQPSVSQPAPQGDAQQ